MEIQVDQNQNTIWLNLNQISTLFKKDKSVISRNIKNIYQESELHENSTLAFFATLFGQECAGKFESSIATIYKSFGGQ